MKVDRLPNISFPFVGVNVSYPGASPLDVESLVTRQIEGSMAGIAGIQSITSTSSEGRASINLQLVEGADAQVAAIDAERRMSAIRGRLPTDIQPPTVNRADPNSFPIMNIALSGRRPIDQIFDLAAGVLGQTGKRGEGAVDLAHDVALEPEQAWAHRLANTRGVDHQQPGGDTLQFQEVLCLCATAGSDAKTGQAFGEDSLVADASQLGGEIDRQRLADVADSEKDRAIVGTYGQHDCVEEGDWELLSRRVKSRIRIDHSITSLLSL